MAWHIVFYKGDPAATHKAGREHLLIGQQRLDYNSSGTGQECPSEKIPEAILQFQREKQVDDWKQVADYFEEDYFFE